MPVINWILNQQIQLGMILCAGLFVPWGQRRSCFVPRLAAGVWAFLALTDTLAFLPLWAKLLLYTTLLFDLIWFSFDCSPLHALFYTTCAYAVQHIASKLAYMPIFLLIQHGRTDRRVDFVILLFSNLVVCLVIYLLFTLRIRRGCLLFDNVKTVLYSGFFLIAAVYLSVVLEDVLDSSAESYLTAYLALNAFCILFAITILALEFSNCSIKSLEHENEMLAQLLECDKQQYEQAKKDMEKINIRYHDLKQQYSRATDEERARLEEEMNNLNLRYFTGNKALDITLTQKSALCGQAGIQLVCSADGSCLENMKHYHIYSLLGNALDNAIECLTQVSDASKRVITLDISRCRDMAVICVQLHPRTADAAGRRYRHNQTGYRGAWLRHKKHQKHCRAVQRHGRLLCGGLDFLLSCHLPLREKPKRNCITQKRLPKGGRFSSLSFVPCFLTFTPTALTRSTLPFMIAL